MIHSLCCRLTRIGQQSPPLGGQNGLVCGVWSDYFLFFFFFRLKKSPKPGLKVVLCHAGSVMLYPKKRASHLLRVSFQYSVPSSIVWPALGRI